MTLTYDIPASRGMENVLKRAAQLVELRWSPASPLKTNSRGYVQVASEPSPGLPYYSGVPYSSVRVEDRFVGLDVSFKTFCSALAEPTSLLYTYDVSDPASDDYHINIKNTYLYYGTVCSGLVCYALDTPVHYSTWEIGTCPHFQAVDTPALGDVLVTTKPDGSTGGHIRIITGIARNEQGELAHIEVTEGNYPVPAREWYAAAYVLSGLVKNGGNYLMFRYLHTDDVRPPQPLPPMIWDRALTLDRGDACLIKTGTSFALRYNGEAERLCIRGPENRDIPISSLPLRIIKGHPRREYVLQQDVPGDYEAYAEFADGTRSESVLWRTKTPPLCIPQLPKEEVFFSKEEDGYYLKTEDGRIHVKTAVLEEDPYFKPSHFRPAYPLAKVLPKGQNVCFPVYTVPAGTPFTVRTDGAYSLSWLNENIITLIHQDVSGSETTTHWDVPGAYLLRSYASDSFGTMDSKQAFVVVY